MQCAVCSTVSLCNGSQAWFRNRCDVDFAVWLNESDALQQLLQVWWLERSAWRRRQRCNRVRLYVWRWKVEALLGEPTQRSILARWRAVAREASSKVCVDSTDDEMLSMVGSSDDGLAASALLAQQAAESSGEEAELCFWAFHISSLQPGENTKKAPAKEETRKGIRAKRLAARKNSKKFL